MRRALLLALLATVCLAAQTRIYRWKDRSGKEYITNTPPPPGATSLDVPAAKEGAPSGPAPVPAEEAARRAQPAPLPGMAPDQEERWKALDLRLGEARAKQDHAAIEGIIEGLFRDCLWGSGLWAIPLLPVATLSLLALLGWWAGSALKQPWTAAAIAISVVLGLLLGQLTLSRFLFRIQCGRLTASLQRLEQHLGGKLPRRTHRDALDQHRRNLEAATRPFAAPWAFLAECRAAEDTMIKVALDP